MTHKIAVVIPCYKVKRHIVGVVAGIPKYVSMIIAVDDACPEGSGEFLQTNCDDSRLVVLFNQANLGVGGATISGYRYAISKQMDIVVKMDGDGQMDPKYLPRLLQPIISGRADFTKGNRFYDLEALRQMPVARRIGNMGLTVLTKFASGFWHLSDPTNGYTAIHTSALEVLNLQRLSKRYFFETSVIIQLNIVRAIAFDVPIPARYGNEESSLSIRRSLLGFPPRLASGLLQRLVWRYFIYDVNAVTLLLPFGLLLCGFGISFGSIKWYEAESAGVASHTGTIALALLPIILGTQMILQALLLDIVDRPAVPLQVSLSDAAPRVDSDEC